MKKVQDVEHHYDNYLTTSFVQQGHCNVRIFEDEKEYTPPVVVLTQLSRNQGVSITSAIEYLCAEVACKFLHPRFDSRVVWLEHYPPGPGRRSDFFQQVRFAAPYPYPEARNIGGRMQIAFGIPTWTPIEKAEVEQMIGTSL